VTLIVSDNSPLNLLVRLGVADVLPALFQQVFIPPQVAAEMGHAKAPPEVQSFIAAPPNWLTIRPPSNLLAIPHLDRGEEAAISLAVELNAVLLVDEHDGRVEAQSRGLSIIGAVGVLERAANIRLVQDLAAVHDQIRTIRFHIADPILKDSLARHRDYMAKSAGLS
jgi:predicted nucleic acid-binding protein